MARVRHIEQAWDWTLAALKDIGRYAAEKGVTICIENTAADSNLVDTAGQPLTLREQVGLSNVQLMFDAYHALYRNEVSSDQVYELGEQSRTCILPTQTACRPARASSIGSACCRRSKTSIFPDIARWKLASTCAASNPTAIAVGQVLFYLPFQSPASRCS
jgi:hypothetical protein